MPGSSQGLSCHNPECCHDTDGFDQAAVEPEHQRGCDTGKPDGHHIDAAESRVNTSARNRNASRRFSETGHAA